MSEAETGGSSALVPPRPAHRRPPEGVRLERSRDGVVAGVAAGIARLVGARPRTVRLLWVVSLPLSGGLTGGAYLLLWLLLPAEKPGAHSEPPGT